MARKRMIDPDFWIDEDLALNCSRDARLLFIGTWNFADDQGRFIANPERLKAQIFPYDDITSDDIAKWLNELCSDPVNCIQLYTVDDKEYGWIPAFLKHQIINRPTESKLPPPPDKPKKTENKCDLQLSEDSVSTHGALTEQSVRTHGGVTDNTPKKSGLSTNQSDSVRTHTQLSEDSVSTHAEFKATTTEENLKEATTTCENSVNQDVAARSSYPLCSLYHDLNLRYPTARDRKTEDQLRSRPDFSEDAAIEAMQACHDDALKRDSRFVASSLRYYERAIIETLEGKPEYTSAPAMVPPTHYRDSEDVAREELEQEPAEVDNDDLTPEQQARAKVFLERLKAGKQSNGKS